MRPKPLRKRIPPGNTAIYVALGLAVGAGIGLAVGAAFSNLPLWLSIGVAIGLALGAGIGLVIDTARKGKRED
jgi:hypothetical protein